jgi:glycosyltransferase involved in cell wall biosynthesis
MTLAVIIPVFNSSALLRETLLALRSSSRLPDEFFVVDDCSTDDSANLAETFGATVLRMTQNVGPAACRNYAALAAKSDILVFLDADTCVHPETLKRMELLLADTTLTGVFGSYDDTPRDQGLCSQYRNLAHCYVHHSSNRAALTFWSGCGAIRREAFMEAEGFDERYRKPSIEDIELGYRMTDGGAHILLDPDVVVTHTKRWTVWNSITTDIVSRGIPWMVLLLERGRIPNDLNLKRRHRVAAALTALSLLSVLASAWSLVWLQVAAILAALALAMDAGLLRFIYRKRGIRLLMVAAAMNLLQNLCKIAAAVRALFLLAHRALPSHRARRSHRPSQIREFRLASNSVPSVPTST